MDDNLIGYLLDGLDPSTHSQVEAYLRSDAQARARLEALRAALAPLEADRDSPLPPRNLAVLTLAHVAEHACKSLPRSPKPLSRAAGVMRPLWARADVLVAACLLLTVIGLGIPAVSRLHQHHVKVECQNNLQQFYVALTNYHNQHGKLPNFAGQEPHRVAGMIAPLLRDAGVLPAKASIRCAASGMPVYVTLSVEQIQSMTAEQFEHAAPLLLPCYGYSLGYRDSSGYHFPDRPSEPVTSLIPLMADRPPMSMSGGCSSPCGKIFVSFANSPNHGSQGQNVLYHDGHVRFATTRNVGIEGDDIYLNRQMQVAPGIGQYDTVLGPSAARP